MSSTEARHDVEAKSLWTPSRVLAAILVANVAVAAAKLLYGLRAESVAIYADGLHSTTDGLNNVIGLLVLRWAMRPPDGDHPYGHRRFEVVATAGIGVVLLVMAVDVFGQLLSADAARLPTVGPAGWALLLSCLAINVAVARWEARMGDELRSPFLLADSEHTRSDVLVTVGVLASAVLSSIGVPFADAIAGAAVGVFITWAGLKILWQSLHVLSDRVIVEPDLILALARSVPGVVKAHAVRSRGAPGAVFVDLSVHVDPDLSVVAAHAISHDVARVVRAEIPDVLDVVVHAEPDGHDDSLPPQESKP